MADDSQTQSPTTHFIPRQNETQALAKMLPLKGVNVDSNRVFNIWGEDGVGKSTFISQFRESELMRKSRVLWLQPTREGELDTIPEFIEACSKTARYPNSAQKEKKIATLLERAQRGKVNPVVSDDSLLITRSSVAKTKKKHVNQAAAASVGRTEVPRDEVEVNVGLGESKSTDHAEGFLDALPLQSLGTDLTIIYLEKLANLSVSVVDWLRDYVFPTATRGPYRRSLVFLIESKDPLSLAYPNETWGEWFGRQADYRMCPLNEYDVKRLCSIENLDEGDSAYVWHRSLGYPEKVTSAISSAKSAKRTEAEAFLESLPESDQARVAALSILEHLYPDELDTLFGHGSGKSVFNWYKQLPTNQAKPSVAANAVALKESLRVAAISKCHESEAFLELADKALPLAKLQFLAPSKNDRSKLLLLSPLEWIDAEVCEQIFGEKSDKISHFVSNSAALFARKLDKYRLSDRVRDDLQETAELSQHPGIAVVAKKATKLWEAQAQALTQSIEEFEAKVDTLESEIATFTRKQSEFTAQVRIQQRETNQESANHESSSSVPKWLRFGKPGKSEASLQGLRQNIHELSIKIHEHENEIDRLKGELSVAKSTLKFPYV